ncbi:mediator of RNA polymerase II transcription subunit 1-like isoform X1 [Pipra filicauda]|uniref:Mediator of RNA polymerase II transcription subunit 1 n=2 Tax=Pipra filicauda TaxID=649802 RepID=A0A6J2FXI5_9PASS|nr:mediator of RNA polymerase II transcription subunit 1-like isoform X1 [Pipra filicauda]
MSVPPACQLILDLENRRGVSCRGVVTAISTNALMEQLCLKYQQRPWTETLRLVYFCMDNPLRRPVSHAPDSPLLSCMEKIERTLHAKSMFSVMNALESLSRQKGLNVHVSPSGTACYITSMMFYLEVQLEKDGNLMDVKLAHFGEAPVVCDDLVQLLRMKNYDAFGRILEDLSNMYQIPGNSEMKAKGYLALQALEKDLYSMSLLDRTQDVNRVTEILHGKVGHLVPRTGGTPMNIEFYISPYQILEAELNPGSQVCGTKTVVTIEGTDMLHKLPLSPLIVDPQSGEDSNPAFLQLTDELSMDLPALFVLKFHQPVPMSSSSIEDIHRLTGIQISGLKLAPLYELIVWSALKDKCSEELSTNESCFFVSLPDCPKHCYFINKGSEKSDLAGALVSKIPFSHPKCVPGVIEILRHQVAYNTLISSCVSDKHINEDDSELLYFEVVPHRNTSFCVFFLHPVKENLACVMIDVITSREVHCHLQLNPQDPALSCSDDFIARAVKRRCSLRRREPRALGHNALESRRRTPPSPHPAQTSAELTGLGQAPTRHFTAEQLPSSPEVAALRGAFLLPRPAADAALPSPRLSAPLTQAPPAAWPLTSVPHRGRQGTSPRRCSRAAIFTEGQRPPLPPEAVEQRQPCWTGANPADPAGEQPSSWPAVL